GVERVEEAGPRPGLLRLHEVPRRVATRRPGRIAAPHDDQLGVAEVEPVVGVDRVVTRTCADDGGGVPPGTPGGSPPIGDIAAEEAEGTTDLGTTGAENCPVPVSLLNPLQLPG